MKDSSRIAFASGKGGTGKTTLAVNLAVAAARRGMNVTYADCDVEEPDGAVFLRPVRLLEEDVTVPSPVVDEERCTGCGKCSEICRFNAIKVLAGLVVSFPELCHSCGGCCLVCPEGAITEVHRKIGRIVSGEPVVNNGGVTPGRLDFISGELDIGEARAVPVIARLLEKTGGGGLAILDSPPGTSCPMMEAIRSADYVVLVAEDSPFGLSDLRLAAEAAGVLGIPSGVVVNRVVEGTSGGVVDFCSEEGLDILGVIPAIRDVAVVCSEGGLAALEVEEFGTLMEEVLDRVLEKGWPEG